MIIELLTGLSPVAARNVVDDALPEEAPGLIREHHDIATANARAAGKGREVCVWPTAPLKTLSSIAAKCTFLQQKRRVTVAAVLPELEQVVASISSA
jgi:hypothetical protein